MCKTKFRLLACVLAVIILAGCGVKSGKIEIINNPNNPNVEKVQLELIKSVNLQDMMENITSWIVADGKVYFCSLPEKTIAIIDFDGNVIKKLASSGRGPGEFIMPQSIIHDEKNSRIEVIDNMLRRRSYFTYDGEYIEDVMLPDDPIYIPQTEKLCGEYDVEYIFGMNITPDNIVLSPAVQIVQPDTNIVLVSHDVDLNIAQMDPSQMVYLFTCDDDEIYISDASTDRYTIDVYNTKGEKIKEIHKQYKKIRKSPEEIAKMKEQIAEYEKLAKDAGGDVTFDLSKFESYEAISQLLVDNDNNVWVGTHDAEKNFCYDILDQKGKIIKRCDINKDAIGINIYENKLIEIIKNPDDGYTMNVYEIKL